MITNKPTIYMLLGLPLSGKTTYSKEFQKQTGLKRLSLDEEVFKIAGNKQNEKYDLEAQKKVEEMFQKEIVQSIKNSESLILDFCPWKKERREEYKKLIGENGGIRKLIYFDVSLNELKTRINGRNILKNEHYQYITPAMLDDFIKRFDVPENEGEEIIQ